MFTRGEVERACGASKVHGETEYCPFHLQRDGKKEGEKGLGCVIILFVKLKEGSARQETRFPTLSLQATLGLTELRVDSLIKAHGSLLFKHYLG